MVFGTFDDLHPGHLYLLSCAHARIKNEKLKIKNSVVYVVVARDANVFKIKGRSPLQSEEIRAQAIRDAFPEAEVILGDPEDFMSPILELKPDLILIGYDQKLPPGVTEELLGCPVERLDAFEPEKYKSSIRREMRDEK